MSATKKMGAGSYLNLIAAVLGIVGVTATVVSSNIGAANALQNLTTCIVAGVVAILLCVVAVVSSTKLGNDYIRTISAVVSIALYCYVLYSTVSARILMIAGLFSYNSGNMEGWSVFYAVIVSAVGLLVATILVTVGSYLKGSKN